MTREPKTQLGLVLGETTANSSVLINGQTLDGVRKISVVLDASNGQEVADIRIEGALIQKAIECKAEGVVVMKLGETDLHFVDLERYTIIEKDDSERRLMCVISDTYEIDNVLKEPAIGDIECDGCRNAEGGLMLVQRSDPTDFALCMQCLHNLIGHVSSLRFTDQEGFKSLL